MFDGYYRLERDSVSERENYENKLGIVNWDVVVVVVRRGQKDSVCVCVGGRKTERVYAHMGLNRKERSKRTCERERVECECVYVPERLRRGEREAKGSASVSVHLSVNW